MCVLSSIVGKHCSIGSSECLSRCLAARPAARFAAPAKAACLPDDNENDDAEKDKAEDDENDFFL